ncbi:Phosphatidylinositolglycan class N-domain-containing protein [Elsinoe ampelina]|uniref:GPI ethanolamine phosphate transferase 1 n=1 Tax=Elsinoe ampelina TaxID=302913 RepID=A0A6A6GKW1_9PEZI|nr:Phosphatidylinositolglycan class N-domain-containing protein [Elsinoe ampelina]
MARLGRTGFLAIAVLFHITYIFSIFDIYFVSPIVHGMKAYRVESREAPAKRLVLFVGDGLRADKAFQYHPDPSPPPGTDLEAALVPRPLAPFLRSRVLDHGTFGVSHTRVPTESRPGHVALIAGLYEDVSSVTTGWKLNPVEFDSVFNRSTHTWSWGSPDILPMFSEGAIPGRVDSYTYGAEEEDFSKDATELDIWVFDHVKDFFTEASKNETLGRQIKQEGNVFFLHLLGLDTTGHGYRPYSKEYLNNIKVVDEGVKEITELVESFFGDDKTAFVFTADHGMSDWGSHGDGHPDNTRTPLIAWGSGVAKPRTVQKGLARGHEDGFSSDWHLDQVQRNDVAQADVATLMAYLAGLEFPVNSVGELPLEYVASSDAEKAEAMLVNARGILEMYRIKEQDKIAKEIRYKPFHGFGDEEHSIEHRLGGIQATIDKGEYQQAIRDSDELMKLGLDGLRYLQTYDWLFLRTMVTAGYLGWIAFSFTMAIDQHVLNSAYDAKRTTASTIAFSSFAVGLFALLAVQSSPITYYAYAIFPVIFWEEVWTRRRAIVTGAKTLAHSVAAQDLAAFAFNALLVIGLMEIMVQSYYYRESYTIMYLLGIIWPVSYGFDFLRKNFVLCLTWILCCIAMSIFTLLPAMKVESSNLISLGGFFMLILGVAYISFSKSVLQQSRPDSDGLGEPAADGISRAILGVQVGLIALAILVTRSSVASLQAKTGLPLGTQVVGWIVLASSLILPFAHSLDPNNHYLHRLMIIFLTFAPMFIILTISYEGLFYLAFSLTLITWVRLEHRIYRSSLPADKPDIPSDPISELNPLTPALANGDAALKAADAATSPKTSQAEKQKKWSEFRTLTLADTRIALFFLYLLQSGFFSTGNIASVSSFSLDAVNRLIPVFDPFSQGALLLMKILSPFVLVSANLGILSKRLKLRGGALYSIVTGIGDWLTLRFFWAVKDEGSWLEIGESISVFVIASCICIFVAALETVSEVLVGGIEFNDEPKRTEDKVKKEGNGTATKVKIEPDDR